LSTRFFKQNITIYKTLQWRFNGVIAFVPFPYLRHYAHYLLKQTVDGYIRLRILTGFIFIIDGWFLVRSFSQFYFVFGQVAETRHC
jgi:hypothetical protein